MAGKVERWQGAKVYQNLIRSTRYLARLVDRMAVVGFMRDDKLYRLARDAHYSMLRLVCEAENLSRNPKDDPIRGVNRRDE